MAEPSLKLAKLHMAFGLEMTHQWPVTQATWEFPPFLWWASRAVIHDSHLSASSSLHLPSREQWTIFGEVWKQVSGEWESYWHVWTEVQAKPSLDLLGTSLLIYLTIPSYREGGGSQWSSFECVCLRLHFWTLFLVLETLLSGGTYGKCTLTRFSAKH